MKKYLLLLSFFVVALYFSSCSEKDDPEPHIVGVWTLEGIVLSNLPTTHTYMNGLSFNIEAIYTTYTLEIQGNDQFILRITPTSGTSRNEQGTWSLDETEENLILDFGDDVVESWEIDKNELDQLWISIPSQDVLPSDEAMDNLVATNDNIADLNAAFSYIFGAEISDQEFSDLTDIVTLNLDYRYIRSTE